MNLSPFFTGSNLTADRLLCTGETVGASDTRAEARRAAEEGLLQSHPHRVPADAVRDPHGRHTVEALQAEQGHGGRQHPPPSQEGCARRHT